MCPSGRNEILTVNTVDESSKSPLVDLGENIEECKEQVGKIYATNLEAAEYPQGMMLALALTWRDSMKNEDITQGSSNLSESDRRTSFCINMMYNGAM